jgi:hypothetical protein
MKIRFACASAATALGLACSSNASAKVVVAYAPATVAYAPPPRPAYYYAPPAYVMPMSVPATITAGVPPPVPKRLPLYTTVVVPAPTNYAAVPAANVVYAQPVMAVPR